MVRIWKKVGYKLLLGKQSILTNDMSFSWKTVKSEVCVYVNGMNTKPFSVSVGLQQGCVLSLLFIV